MSSEIAAEMKRRQDLAEAREADLTLSDLWAGNTSQKDMDSHQFWFNFDGPEERPFDEQEECPCDVCNGVVLFV